MGFQTPLSMRVSPVDFFPICWDNVYIEMRNAAMETFVITIRSDAQAIAERINRDRFEGKVPSADDTVRLCELLDILCDQEENR